MIKEFKEFMLRGNVMDLAVAVIIGGAFTAIVTSLVNDIIMPVVGVILGGVDFTALAITVGDANITYGNFIQAIINFLIIALVLFLLIRSINSMSRKKEEAPAAPPEPTAEEKLLAEIRDLLRERR
ncbi:MAG TPA: large-conductance mechanosensitive channel protein MscL [Promineifilum sp.]|nr:large-conductance mechanosensitive channel protein MscL [Promineifilum sp.]HRO23367.1 large-conductance mechanosensitive channel protein MscL [Promineifilum sp.]HRO90179.1 large-conductance mechanosensitive channel protein MscL [Promineifilum sp.]HRQ14407.1 large-conductance mechanosensitive channel protein MscL [Promineifilum sp.]